MRKTRSTQRSPGKGAWADGDFDAYTTALGSTEWAARLIRAGRAAPEGGGGGCARALAVYKPPPPKTKAGGVGLNRGLNRC
jgi:hypothetical protein